MIKLFTQTSTDFNGKDFVRFEDHDYKNLSIYTLDPDWTRKFLAAPEIHESLTLLFEADDKCSKQHIYLKQDQVHFRALFDIRRIRKSDMENFVKNTIRIASAAETVAK